MPKFVRCLFVSLAFAAVVSSTAAGQERGQVQPRFGILNGKWEPSGLGERKVHLDKFVTVTAAERTYAVARLNDIEHIILKAVPEFGHLKFPIFAEIQGFAPGTPKPGSILDYRYTLFVDMGERGNCDLLTVTLNKQMYGVPSQSFIEDALGKPVPGASFTSSELVKPPDPSYENVIFIRTGESPYTQLTREEFRRWQILEEDGANGEKAAKAKNLLATTPYQRYMAGAAERKAQRDSAAIAYKGLMTPAAAAAIIKDMEDADRQTAARLKAEEADDRKQNESISSKPSISDNARASIARMSAAERKMPAYVLLNAVTVNDTLYAFGTADSANAARAVRPNAAFWTPHRSRVEVRTIHLAFRAACPKEPPPPDVHAALWKLRQNMDWAALKRMVNEP